MKAGGWLLLAGSVVTGALNYGYTVVLIYLLTPADFSQVASASSLLLLVGTAAGATIPWVLAREIGNSADSSARRRAVGFALTASLGAAVGTSALLAVAEARYASIAVMVLSGATCLGIFVTAAGAGYLQGVQRFRLLAGYRLGEVGIKVVFGITAAMVARSAEAGIAGFAVGSVACAGWALWLMRRDIGVPGRSALGNRVLWHHAGGNGAVQSLCALLQALDVLVLSLTVGANPAVAGYQGMLVLGRIPLYVSVALSTVAFPRLANGRATIDDRRRTVREMLTIYTVFGLLIVGALGAVPDSVLAWVLPAHYLGFTSLLMPLAVGGFFAGLITLVTTFRQAAGRYRSAAFVLAAGVVLGGPALIVASGDLLVLAWTAAGTLALTALGSLALLAGSPGEWPRGAETPGEALRGVVRHATRTSDRRAGQTLIFGNYGNGNTGDESIIAGLISLTDRPDLITVVSRNPDQVTELHGVRAVRTLSGPGARAFLTADSICIGGGGIFGHGLPPLVRVLPWVAVFARLLGKDLYFLSLGAYSTTPWTTKAPLQLAARIATAVTVRDPESQGMMSGGLSGRRDVAIVPDPSTMVEPASAARVARLVGGSARPLLLNVKAMPDRAALERVLDELGSAVAAWAATNDNPIYLVSMSTAGDYGLGPDYSDSRLGARLIERAGLVGRITVFGPDLEPGLVKGLHAQALGVVAMRLHSQIFATTTGAPLLGISFEPKSRLWLAQTDAVDLPADQATAAGIEAWLHRLPAGDRRPNARDDTAAFA